MWWQTPFGLFGERYKFSKKDPIEASNRNLRISKVTSSHAGLYSCYLVDDRGATVIPYRVNILNDEAHKTRTRTRTARGAGTATSLYSGTQFAAAVSSSVLLTFIGAFTLGAFSQPYVIKCLQRAKARMCPRKSSDQETTRADKSQMLRTAFYRRNPNSEGGTVEFSPGPSTSVEASSNIKTNQENQDGTHIEGDSVNSQVEPSKNGTSNGESGEDQEGEEQEGGQAPERIVGRQPKRISRVIKLYNYDEEGNRYSHIKEPEGDPTPRQRVMSLTRLQTIMNEVESPDFPSSKESTQPHEALSTTSDI